MLDFLESLPEDSNAKESDKDIMDFLDQLGPEKAVKEEPVPVVVVEAAKEPKQEPKQELQQVPEPEQTKEDPTEDVIDAGKAAAAMIGSWWSNATSQATSTIWDTAQAISKLTPDDIKDHQNLNEAKKVLDLGFNRGIDLISNVIQTINFRDEILEIVLIHDIQIDTVSQSIKSIIKDTFEQVMNEQVDGTIEVKVIEKSVPNPNSVNWNMFVGKSNDVEKLSKANITAEVKSYNESKDQTSGKVTKIFISVIPFTISNDLSKTDLDEPLSSISSNSFTFFTKLLDTTHDIEISSNSQPLPLKWSNWCQNTYNEFETKNIDQIDPKDWVEKWVTQSICDSIGVISQSYIIKRMGY